MKRRALKFHTIDDAIGDIDELHAGGCERLGAWDLAKTCDHLTVTMRMSLDGYPPEVRFSWPARVLGGTVIKWTLVGLGRMPRGIPLPHASMNPQDVRAEQTAMTHCIATLREFGERTTDFYANPLMGKLSPQQYRKFHLVHAAHHLSLLLPQQ
jgi:hypothetical protein